MDKNYYIIAILTEPIRKHLIDHGHKFEYFIDWDKKGHYISNLTEPIRKHLIDHGHGHISDFRTDWTARVEIDNESLLILKLKFPDIRIICETPNRSTRDG